MSKPKHFTGFKAKIMIYALIPIVISYTLLNTVFFASFFGSLHETAKAAFMYKGEKYAASFKSKINTTIDYLSIVSSLMEAQMNSHTEDRELLQSKIFTIFDNYGLIDGSNIYFEPNMYDGRDAEYAGTQYGSSRTGRISFYYYKSNGRTSYMPAALENEKGFDAPRYTDAKFANAPVYTEPIVYEINGNNIPMFTIAYPIRNSNGQFIGAVTADLYLEELYEQIQSEVIYETGYILIANDKGHVIYSPKFEDIGKTREAAGLNYPLPTKSELPIFINANSIINQNDTLVAIYPIYIPQLDSYFYVSIAAPLNEINSDGTLLTVVTLSFSVLFIVLIALFMNYMIGRITQPIKKIAESAVKIAEGDFHERITGDYNNELEFIKASVNLMAGKIESHMRDSEDQH